MASTYFDGLVRDESGPQTSKLIDGVCLPPRIPNHYDNPSIGYGGYCLSKDSKRLRGNYADRPHHVEHTILDSNRSRKDFMAFDILKRNPKARGNYRLAMKDDSQTFGSNSQQGATKRFKAEGIEVIGYEPALKEP